MARTVYGLFLKRQVFSTKGMANENPEQEIFKYAKMAIKLHTRAYVQFFGCSPAEWNSESARLDRVSEHGKLYFYWVFNQFAGLFLYGIISAVACLCFALEKMQVVNIVMILMMLFAAISTVGIEVAIVSRSDDMVKGINGLLNIQMELSQGLCGSLIKGRHKYIFMS